jgi:hypothetical protein
MGRLRARSVGGAVTHRARDQAVGPGDRPTDGAQHEQADRPLRNVFEYLHGPIMAQIARSPTDP